MLTGPGEVLLARARSLDEQAAAAIRLARRAAKVESRVRATAPGCDVAVLITLVSTFNRSGPRTRRSSGGAAGGRMGSSCGCRTSFPRCGGSGAGYPRNIGVSGDGAAGQGYRVRPRVDRGDERLPGSSCRPGSGLPAVDRAVGVAKRKRVAALIWHAASHTGWLDGAEDRMAENVAERASEPLPTCCMSWSAGVRRGVTSNG
jgi:hypothetical protein